MSATTTQENKQIENISKIQYQSLVAGDIIATRAFTMNSKGIRFVTHANVSHAILYTGADKGALWAVDAMPEKGVTQEQLWQKLGPGIYAVVFRHRCATVDQRSKACQWAMQQAYQSKPYDYCSAAHIGIAKNALTIRQFHSLAMLLVVGDVLSAWGSRDGQDSRFMCSELVFRAYEIAGAPLTPKPAHCLSPGMLFKTDCLECLGRLI
jgi:uncharacterized protein YycO